jgi:hypothetical protein
VVVRTERLPDGIALIASASTDRSRRTLADLVGVVEGTEPAADVGQRSGACYTSVSMTHLLQSRTSSS